jgi:hypothetical protein
LELAAVFAGEDCWIAWLIESTTGLTEICGALCVRIRRSAEPKTRTTGTELYDIAVMQYLGANDSSTIQESAVKASQVNENERVPLSTNFRMTSRDISGLRSNHYLETRFTTKPD